MRLWWKDLGHSFFYKRMALLTNCISLFSWRKSLKFLSRLLSYFCNSLFFSFGLVASRERKKLSSSSSSPLFNWNCIKEEGLHLLLPWTTSFGNSLPSLLLISLILSCLFPSLPPMP